MYVHISFMCVCGEGEGGCNFLSRAERKSVSDFVEIVTFPCMSMVRYNIVKKM